MAEKTKKPGFFSRYIGGLLGEDAESMTQDDRRRATLSLLGSFGRNYLSAGSGDESLAAMRASRAAERKAVDDARRTAAAEAEMPRIAGRLFGGSAGMIESLPGQPEEESRLMTSRYRIDPRDAMARLTGTQAGRDAARLAPDLATFAAESIKPNQPNLTNDQREYLTARTQGYPGTFMEYQIAVKGASAPRLSVSTGERGENKAQEALAGLEATDVSNQRGFARGAARVWNGAQKLIDLSGTGALSGSLAPGLIGVNNFLVSIFGTGVDPKLTADAEQFNAAVSQLVIDQMSSLGGARGFSREETALLEKSFPNIATSTQARIAIARLLQAKALESINSYNENLADFQRTFPNLKTSLKPVELPKAAPGTRPAGVSAQEWANMPPEDRALFK
jgi:hypothetical protein